MGLGCSEASAGCAFGEVENVVIEPGLVLLRGAIPEEMQLELASAAIEWGNRSGEDGFFTRDDTTGEKTFNAAGARGRIYDHISKFPDWVLTVCNDVVKQAMGADPSMPPMACTHLLLNYYTSAEGLCWHRDIYENDGAGDHPIVNISVGSACRFRVKHFDEDEEREIVLRSGDVLLFGGPCRYIKHTVQEVLLDDLPQSWPLGPGRFSFTFRDAPEIVGREDEFKYFKPSKNLISQDEWEDAFRKGLNPPLIKAQGSQSPTTMDKQELQADKMIYCPLAERKQGCGVAQRPQADGKSCDSDGQGIEKIQSQAFDLSCAAVLMGVRICSSKPIPAVALAGGWRSRRP
jgi:alkylated DNA repair dioxygenase AlkB